MRLRELANDGGRVMSDDMALLADMDVPHWFEIGTSIRELVHGGPAVAPQAQDRRAGRNYTVILTSGCDDTGKRATLAFAAACAAIALNFDTQVFLIGDGSHWAYEGSSAPVTQPGFPPLSELMDIFTGLGGKTYLCATCESVCSVPGEDGDVRLRRQEIQPRGLAAVLSDMVGGTSMTF